MKVLIQGVIAMSLLGPQAGTATGSQIGQPASADQIAQQQKQQQQIPDAPKPQAAGLSGVTPGAGATVSSSGLPSAPGAAPDAEAPGTSLPDSAPAAAGTGVDSPPDLPAPGDGPAFLIRARTNFVDVPFTVKDSKGRLVPGLGWRDVQVYENGYRQHMSVFTVDPFPLSVALVIDQSLPFDALNRVNSALGALGGAFSSYDEVAVFTYNNGVRKQTDFTGGQSPRLTAVLDQSKAKGRDFLYYAPGEALGGGIDLNNHANDNITPLSTGLGHTNGITPQVPREVHTLNDAILEAAKATTRAGRDRRRVVYVISDGKEYGSIAKHKDVIKYLQTNKIAVYATLVGDSAITGLGFLDHVHLPLTVRDNMLPVYTAATGGETYSGYRTKSIEESFQRITEDVRTQYTVGYYSREPSLDGKFRKTEVRVLKPNLSVIAKEGYYPSATAVPPPARATPTATP